jgi:ribosomal protein L11 methyltransferase
MMVFELKIGLAPDVVGQVEEILAENEEQQLMVLEDKPLSRAWLTGYFASREELANAWAAFSPKLNKDWLQSAPVITEMADKDWKESYKEHFKAWKFGRLHWVPVWEREGFSLPKGDQVLWLDPGMAFGTGNHETTRLVVERLVKLADKRGTTGRVVDAGCGSGILALSAAKLGYERVCGFDNDPLAVDVSRENASMNGLGRQVDFFVGDLVTGLLNRQAEVVLANIQSDVLIRFSKELLGAVAPHGAIVLSGILASELPQVREAFVAAVPQWKVDSRVMGEWSDLLLERV